MPLFILSLLLSFSSTTNAAFVDYTKLQYAGEIGLLSAGLGKVVTSNYSFSFLYGYVPESIAGKEIETYSFKNDYSLYRYHRNSNFLDFYIGLNIYHVKELHYQMHRQRPYPRNYYRMSSIRAMLYWGMSYQLQSKKSSIYFESGINDVWIVNYYNNHEVLDPKDYVSLALGWNFTGIKTP